MKKLLLSLLASLALTGGAFAQVFPSLFLAQMNGSGGAVRPAPASGGPASFSSITDTGLTSGRFVLVGTGGLLQDSANFTYIDGTTTGQGIFPVGAVATPSLTFRGDTNTGFYNPAADTLDVAVGGAINSRFVSTHLLLGGLTTDGTGVLQFPASTTSAGGITFGTDANIYRSAAKSIALDGSDSAFFILRVGGNGRSQFSTDGTNTTIGSTNSGTVAIQTNNTTALTIDTSQNATFAGNILRFATTKGIQGSNTNDSVTAGYVGEELKTTVASGSAVSLTTATSTNLASVSLTAGDWDVYSEFIYIPGATTSVSQLSQGISQSTGALPTTTTGAGDYSVYSIVAAVLGANNISQSVGPVRVSLSGTTTVFAVARPTFTISTLTVYGSIRARRVR